MKNIQSFILFFFVIPVNLYAVNYYVSPNGNDGDSGTIDSPFNSIKHAASLIQPGDTVNVLTGVYYESIRISISGTEQLPIVFRVPQGETATVKAQIDFCYLIDDDVQYIMIEGFNLTQAYNELTAHGAAVRIFGDYCIVKDNHCYDNDMAIFIEISSFNIADKNHHNLVIGNIISDSGEAGIRIKRSDNNMVISNLIYHNGYRLEPAGAITYYGTDSTFIVNNTLWNNNGPAIHNYNGTNPIETPVTTNTFIANNISVRDDGGFLFKVDGNMIAVESNIYTHNLWWNGNLGSKIINWGYDNVNQGGVDLSFSEFIGIASQVNEQNTQGSIEADPLFQDPVELLFDLESASPAIDAGTLTIDSLGLEGMTATVDQSPDEGLPDLGYHHLPNIYKVNPMIVQRAFLRIFPNPAAESVKFDIVLPASNQPRIPIIAIFNILGKKVIKLSPETDNPYNHFIVPWDINPEISSGIYIITVEAKGITLYDKLTILR